MEEHIFRPILQEEVRKYLVEKGTTDKCFSCGHEGWFMDGGDRDLYRCIPWGNLGPKHSVELHEKAWGQAVVTMTCKNCGFVRMHDTQMILMWLSSNAKSTKA